jgi:type-F conjugative transfer system protein TrbI
MKKLSIYQKPKFFIVSALLYGAFLLSTSYFFHPGAPQLVTLNVKSIVAHFSNALAENTHLSASQKQVLAQDFSKILQREIQQYQARHHVVILENSGVISGALDITQKIQNRVSTDLSRDL